MLGLGAIDHSWERDGFADVLQAAHPGDETLDAHAEAGVRDRAVFAQIQVPLERFARQFVLFQALEQQVQIVDALAAADDFAVTFGRDEVDAQRDIGAIRGGLRSRKP